ncbi:MAG: hypothetical protein IH592_12280 [Bacteroidales bacterium]|nr:hypothetical protein [Bacteroidales bacterium]
MKQDVIIIGDGLSDPVLLYTLCKFTNVKNIGLINNYSNFELVNSSPAMNIQTLHFGDIETNYTLKKTKKLKLGEAKILGEKIIFNITPSPGAATCLGNVFEDTSKLMEFLSNRFTFDSGQFEKDLIKKKTVFTINK